MTTRRAAPRGSRLAAGVILGLLLASCAVPPPPGDLETLETVSRRDASARERSLAALEARLTLRLDGRATGHLPAMSVQAKLASPDRARLQARWMLGTLFDAALRGDTLLAWVPSERMGFRLPDLSDSLGVRDPAVFFGRALAASWQAPHEAWQGASMDSDGVRLAWREADAAWQLRLDRTGRPREVRLEQTERSIVVGYPQWRGKREKAWPQRIELADGEGWVRARLDVESASHAKRAHDSWFAMSLPDDVTPLELDDLKRALARVRGSR
jgi:hypothetical protein